MTHDIPVIYEDEHIIAVNKPARIASVPSEGIPLHRTILGMFQKQCEAQGKEFVPYLLHRLDMQTSGVLLFGKHERDREQLEAILTKKDTHKKYLALVRGIPRGHAITAKLKARTSDVKIFAQTLYKVIRVYKLLGTAASLVEAEIKTGRKHQIRQHFADIKCPVVMDGEYGDFAFNRRFRVAFRLGRQFLHSSSLEFAHPLLGKIVKIEAPLSTDLEMTLQKMVDPKILAPKRDFIETMKRSNPRRENFRKRR